MCLELCLNGHTWLSRSFWNGIGGYYMLGATIYHAGQLELCSVKVTHNLSSMQL